MLIIPLKSAANLLARLDGPLGPLEIGRAQDKQIQVKTLPFVLNDHIIVDTLRYLQAIHDLSHARLL